MVLDSARRASFFGVLGRIDTEFAAEVKEGGCPDCQGPLHAAEYVRQPRGGPEDLPPGLCVRHGLCCGREGCRHRVLPPSVLFQGRRVYWSVVMLVLTVVVSGRVDGYFIERVKREFGVSRQTVKRWQAWYQDEMPRTVAWQQAVGGLRPDALSGPQPGTLLGFLVRESGSEEVGLGWFLAILSGGSVQSALARLLREVAGPAEEGEFT